MWKQFGLMQRKYFPFDKNYILEQAQFDAKQELLVQWVEIVKKTYLLRYNPLGLMDRNIRKIVTTTEYNLQELSELYDELAGIYRYKHGSNQLELLFDGADHYAKYQADWKDSFVQWVHDFGYSKAFLKAVMEAAIFFPTDRKASLAFNRLRNFVSDQFGVKVYKHKGIVPMKIA